LQAFAVAIYQVGCFLGAVVNLFNGEKWGRKPSTFWVSIVMMIGIIMQTGTNGYAFLCVGRVVGGVGNGMVGIPAVLVCNQVNTTLGPFNYSDLAV
jgi:predicted MFS family arabinose efflux permease